MRERKKLGERERMRARKKEGERASERKRERGVTRIVAIIIILQ